ncbi:MAG TPA: acyltransferase family protein, partial [Ferrovibrio sp.]|uniref:acyltransferase family protein n=1 Tax=Ferrovibrio sp. TaxID=1917215 RepID=UPI002B4B1A14
MTASAFPHRPEFAPEPARRFDLDWLRIIAFGLLIFYHIGMYFVTWPWHVKSVHAGPAIQPLMLLTSPWRLALLFLIAGVATRYMAGKFARDGQSRGAMARKRSARLLLPLVFGMLVVVPPQTYAEIVGKLGFDEGFAAFYAKYIGFHDGWQVDGARLIVPTWNHLWFVAYLWVYTMIVLAALPLLHGAPARRLGLWLQRRLAGRGLVVWPALLLIALRLTLRPVFGQTHALFDDWYLHAVYFSLFLFGFGIA